ncbi:MAG: 1-acyl-sn-glycerol-3-phosphate acyltransferase [Candidatus Omnitrophica bacterium]|jgi:1-acyl-sn-glycerol-3-phosphate acyltransferase|nr:1-acyl-sn-glycerol-3-phosphate acyltransferase [Candidatus Omnitrophota bacterium]
MTYEICKGLCFLIVSLFCKIEVKGKDVFPKAGPFILASNHISYLDPEIVGMVCPRQLNYLAKEELFQNKLFAAFLKKINVIPIKRGQADLHVLRLSLKILEDRPLLIFPQGTRATNYDSFKEGVGFLYKNSQAPVIAAKVYGTDKVLPKGAKFLRFGKIKVIFAKVEGLEGQNTRHQVTAKVVETIKSL